MDEIVIIEPIIQNYDVEINPSFSVVAKDGKTAYEIALDNGFIGSEAEWLVFLRGAQGIQGIQGEQGLQGNTGINGIQGIKGDKGENGIQGLKGEIGAKGDTGEQGIQGIKGDKGENGIQGLKGEIGVQGIQGEQGIQGVQGLTGEKGAKGDTGEQGIQGIQGIKGDVGSQGLTGLQGIQGIVGEKGAKGDTGEQGIQGIQGIKGDVGDNAEPNGNVGTVQYNDSGVLNGASNVEIGTQGNLLLKSISIQPLAPLENRLQIYARRRAGADWLEFQRPSGREISVQPHLGLNRVARWSPSVSTTVTVDGMPRTAAGTVSTTALSATNLSTSIRRWRVTSAATANSVADERSAITVCWRGNQAGLGGFTYVNRISIFTQPLLSNAYFGLSSSISAFSTTQNVKSLTNVVGFGFIQGTDTNWQLIHNDATGSATSVDLGVNFPISSSTKVYTFFVYCAPNSSSIWVRCVEEVSGNIFESELTTDIPASNIFLSVRNYMNNGGTASACAYECSGVYLETDY